MPAPVDATATTSADTKEKAPSSSLSSSPPPRGAVHHRHTCTVHPQFLRGLFFLLAWVANAVGVYMTFYVVEDGPEHLKDNEIIRAYGYEPLVVNTRPANTVCIL